MSRDLSTIIKTLAQQSADNSKFANITVGTVTSVSPLKIKISQDLVLPESVLIVPQHLTDYEMNVTIDTSYGWKTQQKQIIEGTATDFKQHDHDIVVANKKIKIHGKLKNGDKVALINAIGGQQYYVLDRI